jgi:hypothetical protein
MKGVGSRLGRLALLVLLVGVVGCGNTGMDLATEACELSNDNPRSMSTLEHLRAVRGKAAAAAREDDRWDYLYLWADKAYEHERVFQNMIGSAVPDSDEVTRHLEQRVEYLNHFQHECGKTKMASKN